MEYYTNLYTYLHILYTSLVPISGIRVVAACVTSAFSINYENFCATLGHSVHVHRSCNISYGVKQNILDIIPRNNERFHCEKSLYTSTCSHFIFICMCFYVQKSWTSATLTTLTPWSYLGMFICIPWLQESVVLSNLKMDFFLPSPSSPSPPSCPPAQEVIFILSEAHKC